MKQLVKTNMAEDKKKNVWPHMRPLQTNTEPQLKIQKWQRKYINTIKP